MLYARYGHELSERKGVALHTLVNAQRGPVTKATQGKPLLEALRRYEPYFQKAQTP
jgi:hypothetical protein